MPNLRGERKQNKGGCCEERNEEKEQKDSSWGGGGEGSGALVDVTEYMDESSLKKRETRSHYWVFPHFLHL